MKNPREILLGRHAAVGPKLDAIRREALRLANNPGPAADAPRTAPPLLVQMWEQLVLPCRAAWTVLAAAWAVILLLQVQGDTPPASGQESAPLTPMAVALLQEQRDLRAELLGATRVRPVERDATPKPRSDAEPGTGSAARRRATPGEPESPALFA